MSLIPGYLTLEEMINIVYEPLNDWVTDNNLGTVLIASDPLEAHEWAYTNNSENVCKWVMVYKGDNICFDYPEAAIVSVSDFYFDCIISRNRSLTTNRGQSLTQPVGNAIPFYQLIDQTRDLIRCIEAPTLSWPLDYRGTTQYSPSKEWIYDGYVISYSIQNRMPRYSNALDSVYQNDAVDNEPETP